MGRFRRFRGIYRGVVVSVHGDKRGSLILRVPEVYGAAQLSPPARPSLGGGSNAEFGSCWIPPAGASVWVIFEYGGNPSTPVWLPGWAAAADSDSDLPKPFKGEDDVGDIPPRGAFVAIDFDGNKFPEPIAKANGQYPNVRGWKSERGHLIIMDDTPGSELLQITHPTGSQIEWDAGGSEVHRVMGGRHQTIAGSEVRHRLGNVDEVIEGTYRQTIRGDFESKVFGNRSEGKVGTIDQQLDGDLTDVVNGVLTKTLGQEDRRVQGNQQNAVLGTQQIAVGQQREDTVVGYISQYIGNMGRIETDVAKSVVTNLGVLEQKIEGNGQIRNEVLGDGDIMQTIVGQGNIEHATTSGTVKLETFSGTAKVAGSTAQVQGTGTAEVTAPSVALGSSAAALGVARQTDNVTVSMGPLNMTGVITTGSTIVKAS